MLKVIVSRPALPLAKVIASRNEVKASAGLSTSSTVFTSSGFGGAAAFNTNAVAWRLGVRFGGRFVVAKFPEELPKFITV